MKKFKKCARETVKVPVKSAKKAGQSGPENRFLPRKKMKTWSKMGFSPTFAFLAQKKTLYSWTLLWTANRIAEALDTMVDDSPYNIALHAPGI